MFHMYSMQNSYNKLKDIDEIVLKMLSPIS